MRSLHLRTSFTLQSAHSGYPEFIGRVDEFSLFDALAPHLPSAGVRVLYLAELTTRICVSSLHLLAAWNGVV